MGNLFLDLGPFTPPTDMLLLLSLLSVASASPLHHYYYGSYNPYVSHYYNVPAVYQVNPNAVYGVDPSFRGSWPITVASVMQEKATFSTAAAVAADATATPADLAMSAKTLTGTVSIKQNPLTFNRGKYTIYLANAPASTKYRIGVAAGCGWVEGLSFGVILMPVLCFGIMMCSSIVLMLNLLCLIIMMCSSIVLMLNLLS